MKKDFVDTSICIRLLLIDDHAMVRESLVSVIDGQPDMEVIAEAGNALEGIKGYRTHRPHVTLMDARMPDMSGIAATAAIVEEFPEARILFLSISEDLFVHARQAGAGACFLKGDSCRQLLATIRDLHQT